MVAAAGSAGLDGAVIALAGPERTGALVLTIAALALMGAGALCATAADPRRGQSDLTLLADKLDHREPLEWPSRRERRNRSPRIELSSGFTRIAVGMTLAGFLSLVVAGVLWAAGS